MRAKLVSSSFYVAMLLSFRPS